MSEYEVKPVKKIAVCITWKSPNMKAPAFWYVHPQCYKKPTFQPGTEWSTRNVMEYEATASLLEVRCTCGKEIGED